MRAVDIIIKKRDGGELSREEIRFFIDNYTAGLIPDEQASALMMAILFRSMTYKETAELTLAMAESGEQVDLSAIPGIKVDKHSTGGIGDKTTLIVGPLTAACGIPVAKMSGRGLGFTGGTLDKLESIPGVTTSLSVREMVDNVNRVGICVAGQTGELAPADKKLYALRDVTGTIDSIPLIAASIMSKKIAAGADAIVLDVKFGSGAFMKTREDAQKLADMMCAIGREVGRNTVAVLNSMEEPLGRYVGNLPEILESVKVLRGDPDTAPDLYAHCLDLAANMIALGLDTGYEQARALAVSKLKDGTALDKFADMIEAQGGSRKVCYEPEKYLSVYDCCRGVLKANASGVIARVDAYSIGMASFTLGAGRTVKTDPADPHAGVVLIRRSGEYVKQGEVLAELLSSKPVTEEALNWVRGAYRIEGK